MRYWADFRKFVVFGLCALVLVVFATYYLASSYRPAGAVFLLLAVVCAVNAFGAGACVTVGAEGIRRRKLVVREPLTPWSAVKEVGVVGINIKNKRNPDHTGVKYIYFSPVRTSEEERFDLCYRWPPRDKIYVRFSDEALIAVQNHWGREIVLYNTGKLSL